MTKEGEMRTIETSDMVVQFDDSQAIKDAVFDVLIKWYAQMESFSGESIMQSDEPQLTAAKKRRHSR